MLLAGLGAPSITQKSSRAGMRALSIFFPCASAIEIIRAPVTEVTAERLFSRVRWYAEISAGISAYLENRLITLSYGSAKLKLQILWLLLFLIENELMLSQRRRVFSKKK